MPTWLRWGLGLAIFVAVVGIPIVHFRATYAHGKRLREVAAGKFYRCGQLTAEGLAETIQRYKIRTVINLQNENPDPMLRTSYYTKGPGVPESVLCESLGAKYRLLTADLLPPNRIPKERPAVLDEYLKILDDETAYPILLHCKAGLHRTGLLTAVYRMEYEGWSIGAATRELRANGFGDAACTTANEYIVQYLQIYQPRPKTAKHPVRPE